MGIDHFSTETENGSHINSDEQEVRPRVSKTTHELVREFTSQAGLNISEAYDYLIGATLSDQQLLEQVLTYDKEYSEELTNLQGRLLQDIVDKWVELDEFPVMEDINQDPDMNGFPIYVLNLGTTARMKRLAKERYPGQVPP